MGLPTPAKPVPITGVHLCRLCSAKPQDGGPQGNYIIKEYINVLVTAWDPYNWCFMSIYSVWGSTRLWASICPDEAEHLQAYSCGETLPIYVLNNVGISWEAYAPQLCWNKLILGCFCVFRGAWCRNTTRHCLPYFLSGIPLRYVSIKGEIKQQKSVPRLGQN